MQNVAILSNGGDFSLNSDFIQISQDFIFKGYPGASLTIKGGIMLQSLGNITISPGNMLQINFFIAYSTPLSTITLDNATLNFISTRPVDDIFAPSNGGNLIIQGTCILNS